MRLGGYRTSDNVSDQGRGGGGFGFGFGGGGAEAVECDLGAFRGERSGDREADPGGGAGDEGGLAFEEHGISAIC